MPEWNQTKIQQLIDNGVEEDSSLEYKADAALDNNDRNKAEITKDVSAMANSAGGVLIYGVKEFDNKAKSHLPERIDPVSRCNISKEWLEQVISNVRPRIENLVIHPVLIDGNIDKVVYVVEVPQSETAHQAKDFKYYRRYNFESVPMADHEVRDVMGRLQHPRIEIDLKFVLSIQKTTDQFVLPNRHREDLNWNVLNLVVIAKNTGRILATYVNCYLSMPERFCADKPENFMFAKPATDEPQKTIRAVNTTRDITSYEMYVPRYGLARHDPILPEMNLVILKHRIYLSTSELDISNEPGKIMWTVFADNAPSRIGEVAIKDIPIEDRRKEEES